MIPGPTAWAILLPKILLEPWSDRRSRAAAAAWPKAARIIHVALRQTKEI
jgi:hypothetical protein